MMKIEIYKMKLYKNLQNKESLIDDDNDNDDVNRVSLSSFFFP